MSNTIDTECNECGSDEWSPVVETEKTGHKGNQNRDPTTKEVFTCQECGAEARRFTDGVSGAVRLSGAAR